MRVRANENGGGEREELVRGEGGYFAEYRSVLGDRRNILIWKLYWLLGVLELENMRVVYHDAPRWVSTWSRKKNSLVILRTSLHTHQLVQHHIL